MRTHLKSGLFWFIVVLIAANIIYFFGLDRPLAAQIFGIGVTLYVIVDVLHDFFTRKDEDLPGQGNNRS